MGTKFIEKKIRFVVARGKDGGWKKWVKVGQKVQSSSYKINKHWGCNWQQDDYIQHCYMLQMKVAKIVDPKGSHYKEKRFL